MRFERALGFWNALLLTIFLSVRPQGVSLDANTAKWADSRGDMYVPPLSVYHSGPFGIAEKPCRSISKKIMLVVSGPMS